VYRGDDGRAAAVRGRAVAVTGWSAPVAPGGGGESPGPGRRRGAWGGESPGLTTHSAPPARPERTYGRHGAAIRTLGRDALPSVGLGRLRPRLAPRIRPPANRRTPRIRNPRESENPANRRTPRTREPRGSEDRGSGNPTDPSMDPRTPANRSTPANRRPPGSRRTRRIRKPPGSKVPLLERRHRGQDHERGDKRGALEQAGFAVAGDLPDDHRGPDQCTDVHGRQGEGERGGGE